MKPNLSKHTELLQRALRVVLSLTLVLYACVPAVPSFAASLGDGVTMNGKSALSIQFAQQTKGSRLDADWKKQEGGLTSSYTIKKGGTYYLGADLEAQSALVIDAPGEDVIVDLNDHKLTIDGAGASARKTMVSIVSARSVLLVGEDAEKSVLESGGEQDVWCVSSEAAGCDLRLSSLSVVLSSSSNAQGNLGTHCVRATEGTLEIDNCSLHMAMGNQALRSVQNEQVPEVPSAVYATSGASSVVLVDCTVTGEGTSGISLADMHDATSLGNAYAVYSDAASTVVRGGSYKAASLRGNATCIYASSLEIAPSEKTPRVSLVANAGLLATGVLSSAANSVSLNAPLSFSTDGEYEGRAQAEAALRSSVSSGFVLGDCAAEDDCGYPVLVMTADDDLSSANASGYAVGLIKGAHADEVVTSLVNALGSGGCRIEASLGVARFYFNAASAEGAVAHISGTYYPTLASALKAFGDGDTLELLEDVGDIEVSRACNEATLDLNGHRATSLRFTAKETGSGLVVRNGAIEGAGTAVSHSSPSPLSLQDIAVSASAIDADANGVFAYAKSGALTLSGATTVKASASRITATTSYSAYGVNMQSEGPHLVVDGASVMAQALTPGISAYALYSSTDAVVRSSSTVNARGVVDTTCAIYAGGSLLVQDSVLDVYTSGLSSLAAGIWMRTSAPVATNVEVRNCSVMTRSAISDVGDGGYPCVLGATNDTGTAAPAKALVLAGENTFVSAGGTHLGFNLGAIELAGDFELSRSSDAPLVVSQSRRAGDVGFSVSEDYDADRMESLAGKFTAKVGSSYEGWKLAADEAAHNLVWVPAAGAGVVEVEHGVGGDATVTAYASLSSALAAAQSGDTVRVVKDFAESLAQVVSQRDLTLDLNGKTLTLRAGGSEDGAVRYTGSGTFTIANGTLNIEVGVASEGSTAVVYRGIAVAGSGALVTAPDAAINVDYTGSTASTAVQRTVSVQGISLKSGKLDHRGALVVTGARSDGGIGALNAYGVYSASASVNVAKGASVVVHSRTASRTTRNTFYAESATTQAGPVGLREIKVDPKADKDLYEDIVRQFRLSATYDDPDDNALRNTFGAKIYFAQDMVLDHDGKWYDGLRVWAYSDEVIGADVGKMASIVPSHIFISTHFDTLPDAYGVATDANSDFATVTVAGSVSADSAHGNAYALYADGASDGVVRWSCEGADLSAACDTSVHPLVRGSFDLRDFIDFKNTTQKQVVAYTGTTTSQSVQYSPAVAQSAFVGKGVSFNADGGGVSGSQGAIGQDFGDRAITFKSGDAVIARYAPSSAVSLEEVSALAKRPSDQRQTYTLIGWSTCPDEFSPEAELGTSGTVSPAAGTVYYAVYRAGLASVPVAFSNIHDGDGRLLPDFKTTAIYGQTIGEAAGPSVPDPRDYTKGGLEYRFVGWFPYTSAVPAGPVSYDSDQVRELAVTVALSGVASGGALELRAVYLPVQPGEQHLVRFVVDGRTSAYVASDGDYPDYAIANASNTSYVTPSKYATEVGKTFTFQSWFVDQDRDGVLDSGEPDYSIILPRALQDAAYCASWSSKYSDAKLTFRVKAYDKDNGGLKDENRSVSTTCEKHVQEVADSVSAIGSKVGFGGKVYTLKGWSHRKEDVEPLYDANNPIPDLGKGERAMNSTYSKTYYGVYDVADHRMNVTFHDGSSVVGTATLSALATVDEAFAATGKAKPADKSSSQQFLGWATTAAAQAPLDGVSASLESVGGATADRLNLYAVYGTAPTYTVRLRSSDGSKVLYRVSVKAGNTLRSAFAAAGVTVSVEAQAGRYFSGWRTAAGAYYSLDDPVSGSADLYASYGDISVQSDSSDIKATVASTQPALERASSVKFSIKQRTSADTPLRYETAQNSYTILKSFDIRLLMESSDDAGQARVVTGSFGTAEIKVLVGKKYKDSSVRVFWLGSDNGSEVVKHSAKKDVDDDGYITVTIDNYAIGDEDEGGNFVVAYIEGGSGNATIDSGKSSASLNTNGGKLNANSLASLSPSSLSGLQPGALASGNSAGLKAASNLASSSSGGATAGSSGSGAGADGDSSAGGGAGDADGGIFSAFAGWDSNAVVLVLFLVLVLAAALYGLWRLVVVRQRRNEAEAELPAMPDRYAEGIHF